MEVLPYVACGLTTDAIAPLMGISTHTAKLHVDNCLRKLGAKNRTELAAAFTLAGQAIPSSRIQTIADRIKKEFTNDPE